MKKILISALLIVFALSANAQSKQELQATINNLNQQIGQLKAMLDTKSAQLDQANQTIADLRQKLANGTAAPKKNATYRDSIADLIEKYTNCTSWQEQLKYVMEPERLRPIMQKYYADHNFSPITLTTEDVLKYKFRRFNGKSHTIYKAFRYYVVQTSEGYRIDWESTVEYNPVSHTDLAEKIGQSAELRGSFRYVSSYNNDYFRGYCSTSFITDGQSTIFLTEKGSPIDKKLFAMLQDDADMLLKVKSELDGEGYQYFLITDIVSTNYSRY